VITSKKQKLFFAVLDGPDPRAWKPWDSAGDETAFGKIYDDCAGLIEPPPGKEREGIQSASFEIMLGSVKDILDAGHLQSVVGVILDATKDPTNERFYETKLEQLEALCRHINKDRQAEDWLINRLRHFELWFVVSSDDSNRWARWEKRARELVDNILDDRTGVDFFSTGSVFHSRARAYLKDSRYWLEREGLKWQRKI
jgi:hypothetical protein